MSSSEEPVAIRIKGGRDIIVEDNVVNGMRLADVEDARDVLMKRNSVNSGSPNDAKPRWWKQPFWLFIAALFSIPASVAASWIFKLFN